MHTTKTSRVRRALAFATVLGLTVAACGDDDGGDADTAAETTASAEPTATASEAEPTATADGEPTGDTGATATDGGETAEPSGEPVTIQWWHIANNDPGLTDFQNMADAYMAENPNITIEVTVLENEAFKAAIQTNLQAGDVPDLFQSWGGGKMREQVEAGLLKDITADVAEWNDEIAAGATSLYQVDGVQYGMPYNAGMVGFWYNKAQFEQAGITAPPTTWDELLDAVQKLKDAGLTPIAVGAGDKWPAHFYYSYLMVRLCGAETMTAMAADGDFSRQCVVDAGQKILDLVALEPFNDGYLGTPWDGPDGESGVMATEGAAMDLMGQWAPGAFRAQLEITDPATPLPWDIGWFPFPSVDGMAGEATDAFGGGDGFVVGKDAPAETVDFLRFLLNEENQRTWAESGSGLPTNIAATAAVTDPNMVAVLEGLNSAGFMQLYLDQFLTAEIAGQVNDQTALLFGAATTPEDAAAAIMATATAG